MYAIFLDYDGVLVSTNWEDSVLLKYGYTPVNELAPELMDNLVKVVEAVPDAKLIITSQWRGDTRAFISSMLQLTHRGLRIWDTVGEDVCTDRSAEIRDYIAHHPEIDHYVILDDEILDPDLHARQVKTTLTCGFGNDKIEEAIRKLKENI